MKTKILLYLVMLQFSIVSVSHAAHLRDHLLVAARIDGAQQVPAITTIAQGVAGLMINNTRDSVCVSVSFSGLSRPLVAAHIHEGLAGMNDAHTN